MKVSLRNKVFATVEKPSPSKGSCATDYTIGQTERTEHAYDSTQAIAVKMFNLPEINVKHTRFKEGMGGRFCKIPIQNISNSLKTFRTKSHKVSCKNP